MQLINENLGKGTWSPAEEIKCFLLTNYKKLLVLPFESEWQWTLHLFSSLVQLVYNIILINIVSDGKLISLIAVNSGSAILTLSTPSKRYVFLKLNFIVFLSKIILIIVSLCVDTERKVEVTVFYVISLGLELVSGSIYNYFLENKSANEANGDNEDNEANGAEL